VDGGETCDGGNRTACDGCSRDCAAEVGLGCGDGVPFPACGELCDDADAVSGDGCSPACVFERVPGGGSETSDCFTEWLVDDPTNVPHAGFPSVHDCMPLT
jgi:cysteine-rich repeat protein